jgi:hypothetical protein
MADLVTSNEPTEAAESTSGSRTDHDSRDGRHSRRAASRRGALAVPAMVLSSRPRGESACHPWPRARNAKAWPEKLDGMSAMPPTPGIVLHRGK